MTKQIQLLPEQQQYLKIVGEPNYEIRKASGRIYKVLKEKNIQYVEYFILAMVKDFLGHFNYSRTLNEEQIIKVIDLILLDYKHWSMLDINECLKRAIRGEYGGFYEGIDVAKMAIIFEKYDRQLADEAFELHEQKKKQEHLTLKDLPNDLISKLSEKFNVKEMPEVKPIPEKSEYDKLIQSYFKDFDLLYDKEPKSKEGQRFVEYKGKVVSVTEYCEIRICE